MKVNKNLIERNLNSLVIWIFKWIIPADNRIPSSTDTLLQNILIVLMSMLLVVMAIPWFLIALAVLGIVFLLFSAMFRRSLRDMTRLEHLSRSPIYSHVDASVNGLSVVHAFGKQRHFISK